MAAIKPRQIQQLFRNGTNVSPGSTAGSTSLYDANTNVNAVLADMQTCQTAALTLPSGDGVQGTLNEDDKGERWAADDGGFTLINTVVPPSSIQYSFACLQFLGVLRLRRRGIPERQQHAPRRRQRPVRRRQRPLPQVVDLNEDVLVLGTKGNGEVVSSDSY